MNFSDKLVLVTGSSRGIGRGIAEIFLKNGAHVILNSASNEAQLLETYETFKTAGYACTCFLGDLSCYSVCRQLFEMIQETHRRLPDILINNAGISHVGLFTETPPEVWQRLLDVNLNSAYNCSHLVVPSMIQAQTGIIINISSIWGQYGASCEVAYSTSKSALNGFTRALAKELGPSGIRVNGIACGWIDTAMNACFSEDERQQFIDEVPLCRTGTVEDVANTCLYLASTSSSYMTGQILTLDGGLY